MTLTTSLRILVAASVLAGSAFAVQAHSHEGKGAEQYKRDHAAHIAELKDTLNLSESQQGAWEQYQAAMQPTKSQREARADKPALTEEQKAEKRQQRDARKQAKEEARKAFSAQLTPEQQQVFDAAEKKGKSQRDGKKRAEQAAS